MGVVDNMNGVEGWVHADDWRSLTFPLLMVLVAVIELADDWRSLTFPLLRVRVAVIELADD